jgi:hypothetical protein
MLKRLRDKMKAPLSPTLESLVGDMLVNNSIFITRKLMDYFKF